MPTKEDFDLNSPGDYMDLVDAEWRERERRRYHPLRDDLHYTYAELGRAHIIGICVGLLIGLFCGWFLGAA